MNIVTFDQEKIIDGVTYELTGFMCGFDGKKTPQYSRKQSKFVSGASRDSSGNIVYVDIPIEFPEVHLSQDEIYEMNYYLTKPITDSIKKWINDSPNIYKDTYQYKMLSRTHESLGCDSYKNMLEILKRNGVTLEQLYAGKNYDIQYGSGNLFEIITDYFNGWDFGIGFENKKTEVNGRYILTPAGTFEDYAHDFPLYVMPIYFHMDFMPKWKSGKNVLNGKEHVSIKIDKVCINLIDNVDQKWQ